MFLVQVNLESEKDEEFVKENEEQERERKIMDSAFLVRKKKC